VQAGSRAVFESTGSEDNNQLVMDTYRLCLDQTHIVIPGVHQ
jgi:hypothetical protein